MEAVGVSEGLQGRNWGQDVTQTDSLPQQPQSDQGTCPPQHLHGTLLTASLQAHPVHLKGGDKRCKSKEQGNEPGLKQSYDGDRSKLFVVVVDGMEVQVHL